MKKLLGILVLGLLWCNVGIAEEFANAGIKILREMIERSTLESEKEVEFQSALYAQIKKMGLGKEKNEDSNDEK